jgi:hypothetical protein
LPLERLRARKSCGRAGFAARRLRAGERAFHEAKRFIFAGAACGFVIWFVGFTAIGGEIQRLPDKNRNLARLLCLRTDLIDPAIASYYAASSNAVLETWLAVKATGGLEPSPFALELMDEIMRPLQRRGFSGSSGDGALAETPRRDLLGQFQVPTKGVGQSHLVRCSTICFEHSWGGDQNTEALGAGSNDIEAVQTVKKFHPSGRIRIARSGHRINHQWRFLTLEFVNGSNPSARQSGLQFEDLGIVWRDDEDVGES